MEPFDKRIPVYEQVIKRMKKDIITGKYHAGEAIPSRRELAQMYQINPNTVQRAYKEMEEIGLIYTDKNVLSRVTNDEHYLKNLKSTILNEALDKFFDDIAFMGLHENQLIEYIHRYYEQKEGALDARSE
ncbi:GntR family transcriptional regulator [Carnobacteriaceae bacterium zg-ZUI78]|uniref:GntR family transcriptional regulator n=1 Tax=Granulicatella sp. zg-84 TaxID=2678503 RepID=UPI0013BF2525|nr:GntR family transcriptional regulator [Granulicatella sp. zg-84]MBS4750584.1 GntR family transcriptional regulator [Carnobacteriaceae bacterium zg-ZUI78]NEW66817.1 GntR family transcriptional regulator [Granulicatella sp. zg-84]QMI85340.1 GntR family transcriptional regulator [Carnobacteriaceae bacterium zg-84]